MFDGSGIDPWWWLVAGVGLAVIEVVAPGVFLLWLGIAAGIVGVVSFILPSMSLETQIALFAILAVVSVVIGRIVMRRVIEEDDGSTLNRRADQYVGRTTELVADIVNGTGKVKLGDTMWIVEGDDMPAGTRVTVKAADGVRLKVVRAE